MAADLHLHLHTQIPALEHMAAADMALRHVAHALLVGVEEKQVSEHALQVGSTTDWEFADGQQICGIRYKQVSEHALQVGSIIGTLDVHRCKAGNVVLRLAGEQALAHFCHGDFWWDSVRPPLYPCFFLS
eukprot:scaffold288485_cov17-Tisochrysis_lutea.AAC.1